MVPNVTKFTTKKSYGSKCEPVILGAWSVRGPRVDLPNIAVEKPNIAVERPNIAVVPEPPVFDHVGERTIFRKKTFFVLVSNSCAYCCVCVCLCVLEPQQGATVKLTCVTSMHCVPAVGMLYASTEAQN